ncbi:FKBP-type peptidyl-prolyl cis-trans isomerase [Stenotrophomonas rhizophila]|uniref:FKBP-type peptidyl-prolyl cis-trans isomerase n=1 Tax=Stenotrophomonas rhizophila TaxID=216778 RepID=UPI001E5BDDF1|nr:FKBP-type peptidyl-prolyl cis-trans isomerase [Stenotrophomonas rhizophila]MCC7635612.1 FKBP-type peptidyl-prolyl cis-trans isomerase [Stenotrophomonas rhizophila]MCC7665233.1 FKBP-type peptidyl-prolyl cis-trans isomerase [Stenotrophomonas rhizophila]
MRRLPIYLLASLLSLALAGCTPPGPPPGGSIATFEKIDTRPGTGAEAVPGSKVTVHYTGWIYDERAADKHGDKFDSSLDRGEPFSFELGQGRVIKGWDEGFAGMKVGGKRTLMIPAEYGYGDRGAGPIRPNSSLVFDVELLDVAPR